MLINSLSLSLPLYKVSKKLFEVVYGEKQTIIKLADTQGKTINRLEETNRFTYKDIAGDKAHNLWFNAKINDDEEDKQIYVLGKRNQSFTIEGMAGQSKEACAKPALDDLVLAHCKGNIKLTPN